VLLLLDATQGVTDQDAHIAGYILESGRAVVLAINKWDAVDAYQRELVSARSRPAWPFLKFAALHFISAKKRQGLGPLWASIARRTRRPTCKMSTPVLTRLLLEAVQFQSPSAPACSGPSCVTPTRAA
jgi:GTP-binding protein